MLTSITSGIKAKRSRICKPVVPASPSMKTLCMKSFPERNTAPNAAGIDHPTTSKQACKPVKELTANPHIDAMQHDTFRASSAR
jgi:hypothetical protein